MENWLSQSSIEFSLICQLCQQCQGRLTSPTFGQASKTSKRRNECRILSFELRKALNRSPSELRLIRELDSTDNEEDIIAAENILRDVCDVLNLLSLHGAEERTRATPRRKPKSRYAQLTSLLVYLEDTAGDEELFFDLISDNDLEDCLFVYPLGPDRAKAIEALKLFNGFIQQLLSTEDSERLAVAPLRKSAFTQEPTQQRNAETKTGEPRQTRKLPSQRLADNFKHAKAAIRAMFRRLSGCDYGETKAHDVLVQLVAADAITSKDVHTLRFDLDLVISGCPDTSSSSHSLGPQNFPRWQEAHVVRLQLVYQSMSLAGRVVNMIKIREEYSIDMPICNAISMALSWECVLHFQIQDELTGIPEKDVLVAYDEQVSPEYDSNTQWKSLQELFEARSFTRIPYMLHYLSPDEVYLVTEDERRSLAIQLLFGLVLCLQYGCKMATWDSERVFVPMPVEKNKKSSMLPYVSCVETSNETGQLDFPNCNFNLTGPSANSNAFTQMAKLLLEIGFGERLPFDGNEDQLQRDLNKIVRNTKDGKGGVALSPEILPYITAAQSCLHFSRSYWKEAQLSQHRAGSGGPPDPQVLVETIVCNQIIHQFEATTLKESDIRDIKDSVLRNTPSRDRARRRTRIPQRRNVVKLFDGSDMPINSEKVEHAEEFFDEVEEFRACFKDYLDSCGAPSQRAVRIAIIDTGIDKNNVELDFDNEHMKDKWCISFVDGLRDYQDNDGHGTHCASLIRKVAPDAEIYVAKVFSGNEFDLSQASNIPKAIRHAVQKWDVDIISMSFGLRAPSSGTDASQWEKITFDIEEEIRRASPRLLFAAAENEGKNRQRAFPSTNRDVFCIHASDGLGYDGGINPDARGAENTNIMTLGVGIKFLDGESGELVVKKGTSFATAIAAGTAAVILDMTSKTSQLKPKSRKALRTRRGMQVLFQQMAEMESPCPYAVPWNLWRHDYWTVDSQGLVSVWARLNSLFHRDPEISELELELELAER